MLPLAAAAGVLVAVAAVALAGRRAARMPIPADVAAEGRLLAALQRDQQLAHRYLRATRAGAHLFAHPEHRRIVHALARSQPVDPVTDEIRRAETNLAQLADDIRQLTDALEAADAHPDIDVHHYLAISEPHTVVHDEYEHREILNGTRDNIARVAGHPTNGHVDRGPLVLPPVRTRIRPTVRSVTVAATIGAVAGVALYAGVGNTSNDPTVQAVLMAWFAVTFIPAATISIVDWWTMWVDDRPLLGVWAAALAVVAAAATWVEVPLAAIAPAVATAVIVGAYEIGGRILSRRRGFDAHGAGDTIVVPLICYPLLAAVWVARPSTWPTTLRVLELTQAAAWMLIAVGVAVVAVGILQRATGTAGDLRIPMIPAWVLAAPPTYWATTVWL